MKTAQNRATTRLVVQDWPWAHLTGRDPQFGVARLVAGVWTLWIVPGTIVENHSYDLASQRSDLK